MQRIDPVRDLGWRLNSVQNPARYLGGEYGAVRKESADLTFALAFPDLYEIAMSNLAVKVLYDGLNRISNVRCERVFAPAPDFEGLLSERNLPLYTLESGIPLHATDILGVSIGYEPGITGLLSILASGGIPLDCADRGEDAPIVIAGGCGITNPAPFSRFVDAFFIGEAEAGFFALISSLAEMKRLGASRSDILERIAAHPSVWTRAKNAAANGSVCARRAVYAPFGGPDSEDRPSCLPVPNIRIVQDHGSVEIMRGCPNGCRFCHAGVYYRPQRMKAPRRILEDVDYLIGTGGYREISLMSLSSGDYEGIDGLLDELIQRHSRRHVSFQLPSLKVNSFTLPLLEKLAEVRKSGLTFAIETPVDSWQLALNKEVCRERILGILHEARKRGWNKAKFYFMVGLPVGDGSTREETEIVDFMLEIQERTRMQCNVNVGTFIPKPHTPFQWARQLSESEADDKLSFIHRNLPKGRFKVSTHRPFSSFLESMISRGDERVGDIILDAWNRGCRLDAWEDYAKPDVWRSAIAESGWDVVGTTIRERGRSEPLPWDGVSLGPPKGWYLREAERSRAGALTGQCAEDCAESCGTCIGDVKTVRHSEDSAAGGKQAEPQLPETLSAPAIREDKRIWRVVLSFVKTGPGAFIPHLGLLEVWHKTFNRAGLSVVYTEGFNPLPRFEIAQSLSLGVTSDCEIASFMIDAEIEAKIDADAVRETLNRALPEVLRIERLVVYPVSTKRKRESLSTLYWGAGYRYSFHDEEASLRLHAHPKVNGFIRENGIAVSVNGPAWSVVLPARFDRPFRDTLAEAADDKIFAIVDIHKMASFAVPPDGGITAGAGIDYFDAFRIIAQANKEADTHE